MVNLNHDDSKTNANRRILITGLESASQNTLITKTLIWNVNKTNYYHQILCTAHVIS